jgi:hypothetical protein
VLGSYLTLGTICSIVFLSAKFVKFPIPDWVLEIIFLVFPYSAGVLLAAIDLKITGRFFDLSLWIFPTLWLLALGCGWGGFAVNRRHGVMVGWFFFGAVVLMVPLTLLLGWLAIDCLQPWGPEFCRVMRSDAVRLSPL